MRCAGTGVEEEEEGRIRVGGRGRRGRGWAERRASSGQAGPADKGQAEKARGGVQDEMRDEDGQSQSINRLQGSTAVAGEGRRSTGGAGAPVVSRGLSMPERGRLGVSLGSAVRVMKQAVGALARPYENRTSAALGSQQPSPTAGQHGCGCGRHAQAVTSPLSGTAMAPSTAPRPTLCSSSNRDGSRARVGFLPGAIM